MADRTCSIVENGEPCPRTDIGGRGWCNKHYTRWKRYGDPLAVTPRPYVLPTVGTCSIVDNGEPCPRPETAKGMCSKHYQRKRLTGDPLTPMPYERTRGVVKGYRGAHQRIRRAKGHAGDYPCVDCGERAKDWSYRHDASQRLIDEQTGRLFSLNPDDYVARCKSCHTIYDNKW